MAGRKRSTGEAIWRDGTRFLGTLRAVWRRKRVAVGVADMLLAVGRVVGTLQLLVCVRLY